MLRIYPALIQTVFHVGDRLPRCIQSINSLIYVYSIQIPSCFYECLITVVTALLCTIAALPKKNLYYPLYIDTVASNIPQMKIKATSQWLIKQLIKQFARFMQRKPKKCWCLLRNLSFGLFDHKKISGLFQDFSKKISAKFQDFPGLSSTSRTFQVFPGLVGTMCSLKRDSGIGVFLWILRNF